MKIATAANRGDRLVTLKALRQKIAKAIDDSQSARDIAALSRQLQSILQDIDDIESLIPPEKPQTVMEKLQAKHRNEIAGQRQAEHDAMLSAARQAIEAEDADSILGTD